mmetsp:Transcript_19676/g.36961  ORF Transcript_19676/g.36961 Transcript_19676/m.36961 type:complete len:306 (-) Transcript_19676:577-1494(-)
MELRPPPAGPQCSDQRRPERDGGQQGRGRGHGRVVGGGAELQELGQDLAVVGSGGFQLLPLRLPRGGGRCWSARGVNEQRRPEPRHCTPVPQPLTEVRRRLEKLLLPSLLPRELDGVPANPRRLRPVPPIELGHRLDLLPRQPRIASFPLVRVGRRGMCSSGRPTRRGRDCTCCLVLLLFVVVRVAALVVVLVVGQINHRRRFLGSILFQQEGAHVFTARRHRRQYRQRPSSARRRPAAEQDSTEETRRTRRRGQIQLAVSVAIAAALAFVIAAVAAAAAVQVSDGVEEQVDLPSLDGPPRRLAR